MNLEKVLANFDYQVQCDDFLLYELGRLIEEDRASLDDEEFREIVDEGIHEHVETRLEVRADIAKRLRLAMPNITGDDRAAAVRVLRAVEDIDFPLRDVALILTTYTSYLFQKLEDCASDRVSRESEIADALFECLDDRPAVDAALNTLGSIRSSVSARILAHLVSEPMLEEDLETKAYDLLRGMWPLPRHYILYSLKGHNHEDIPFRWFQLLIESNEPEAVDRIMEELRAHADDPTFREDLLALIEVLSKSANPETEYKIMQVLNDPQTPRSATGILEEFLRTAPQFVCADRSVWETQERLQSANKKYQAAAKLCASGRKTEAIRKLDELLKEVPDYPFAVMLSRELRELH
jgi:tetratricopeptide (TPR) repeat protein